MKHALCLFVFVLIVAGCKHNSNDVPTPTNPLDFSITSDSVKVNPYGYTPLAALVNFTSLVEGKTFIRVRGKHGSITNVEHVFNDKGTYHSIPVIGLYANYLNTVDIRLLNDSGDTLTASTFTIQTGDLPPNMPTAITAIPFDESKVTPGLVLVSNYSDRDTGSPSTPFLMDAYGDIRWVLDYRNHTQLKTLSYDDGIERLRNGNFFFGDINSSTVYEVDLLGKVVNSWSLQGYVFHHNVSEKPDGNFIITATKPGSLGINGVETIEDYVIELDRNSGQVLNEWDLKESLDEQRTALSASSFVTANDWFHGNSVIYDSTDNTIIVSGRHQGVIKLDYQNQIKWILAPHRGWGTNRRDEDLNQYLLQPLDANGVAITDAEVLDGSKISTDFEWNWYQHSNILLPTGETMVFDNGDIREYDSGASRYSRAVSYKIDPVKMTVQQIWTYGKERGTETYSQIISSVQYLSQSNHVLFAPGYQVPNTTGKGGKVVEIDMSTKEVVSEISISAANLWGFHRAKKMSAYPSTL